MSGFQPIMQPDQVATTARYYNEVFVPLGEVTPMMSTEEPREFQAYMAGFEGMQADSAKLVPLLAQAMNMTPAQVQQMMAENLPAMAAMLQNMPQMQRDFNGLISTMRANEDIFSQVPAGLAHHKAARRPLQANVDNGYADVNSLPSFHFFTWFFVIPGVLLIAIAGYGLWTSRAEATHGAHHAWPTPA